MKIPINHASELKAKGVYQQRAVKPPRRRPALWKDLPLSEGELRGVGRKRLVRSWSRQKTTYLSDPVEVIYSW
jgi:hypothetical protein